MKKFFSILCLALLSVSLLLPFGVLAAESTGDYWSFNDTIDMAALVPIADESRVGKYTVYVDFTFNHPTYGEISCIGFSYESLDKQLRFVVGGGQEYPVYTSNGYADIFDGTIKITSSIPDKLIDWLMSNATTTEAPKCDGTACSWADDDYNGYCDTCGMALMSFRYDYYEYAQTLLSQGQNHFSNATYWYIGAYPSTPQTKYRYKIFISSSPFEYDGGFHSDSEFYTADVVAMDDGTPASQGWITLPAGTVSAPYTPVDSNHDIDGFFPLTLHQTIHQVAMEGLTQEVQKLSRTMTVLMISGVACLALLTGLVLFGKRSLIYRS